MAKVGQLTKEKNPFFGKKHTEETKRKIGESRIGKLVWNSGVKNCFSEETRKIMSEKKKNYVPWNKGRKGVYSKETISKFSESKKGTSPWNKGKKGVQKHSEEWKKNHSNRMKGENHPLWNGGISTDPYCFIFVNKDFRGMIFGRDHYTCQNCGITRMLSLKVLNEDLVLHHINYDKKDCDPKNVITTCNSCNSKANFNRELRKKFYSLIIEGKL